MVRKIPIFLVLILSIISISYSAYIENAPIEAYQPSGLKLELYASGDEYFNRLHDKEGYTVMVHPDDGYYVYAIEKDSRLIPSDYIVGKSNPELLGIPKGLIISEKEYNFRRNRFRSKDIVKAPSRGTLNNIVIFIRFADDTEFSQNTSYYNDIFNQGSDTSMYTYYQEASYGQISIISHFYPTPPSNTVISYQDSQPRNYYRPYNANTNPIGYGTYNQRTLREHTLLKNAIEAVEDQIPEDLDIDRNNNGYVDNVCFIIRGNVDGWNDLLWPHMWALFSFDVRIHGKRVWTYNFNIESFTHDSSTISHEMFHSLGAPDLYRYNNSYNPVGIWDIMASSTSPPQHMGAYMKYRYGNWISEIPEITSSGTYTINPLLEPDNNVFKISMPGSNTEYFLVEFRNQSGNFESNLPGSGLLVYRINTNASGQGNAGGPPDEVYVFRPYGSTTSNGNINNAFFHDSVGRTEINNSTNPYTFYSNGNLGGLNISNIYQEGNTMSFYVDMEGSSSIATPVYRFFNTNSGGHLYTISEHEKDHIMNNLPEWNYEGISFGVYTQQEPNTLPSYRFFNTTTGIHIYTISENERDTIMQLPEWNYEGVSFYVNPGQFEGTTPVYRFFNHIRGGHLYTISENERDTIIDTLPDWSYEGISFYVVTL